MSENSRIVVNLNQPPTTPQQPISPASSGQPGSSFAHDNPPAPKKRGGCGKALLVTGVLLLLVAGVAGIAGYWYYTSLLKSPSYSLALLVKATRENDQKGIDEHLDTDKVVENFLPQVTEKARERYGRSFPPEVVERAMQILQRIVPDIKNRAKKEIPRVIKEKAASAPNVSPWMMTFGINRVVNVDEKGDQATVKSAYENRPFELTMQRETDHWKVVGFKDEALADQIVNQVGQQIMAEASGKKPGGKTNGKNAPRSTIDDIRKQVEELVIP